MLLLPEVCGVQAIFNLKEKTELKVEFRTPELLNHYPGIHVLIQGWIQLYLSDEVTGKNKGVSYLEGITSAIFLLPLPIIHALKWFPQLHASNSIAL